MYFAQFYQKSATNDAMIEACGDRAVIILDGRNSQQSMGEIAAQECQKRGFIGWSIHKGESFTRESKISGPWRVYSSPSDNSAMSANHGA